MKQINLVGAIGKRPCEIVLQKIMEELGDRKVVNRVMNIIYDFRDGLKQINYVPSLQYRKRFTFEWHQRFSDRVFSSPFPKVVQTHLWCCMTAYYREHVHSAFCPREKPF